MAKKFLHACCGLLMLALGTWGSTAQAQVVVAAYGSCGWKWAAPTMSFDPLVVASVGFNDSGWSDGCAPFVASWGCAPPGTVLPEDKGVIVIRRRIFNAGPSTVAHLSVKGRWQLWTYWNGHDGSAGMFGNACPATDGPTQSFTLDHGDNVVMVRGASFVTTNPTEQIGGYIDIQVTADQFTGVTEQTWGRLKILYR